MISRVELEIMTRAWRDSPDSSTHPRVRAMVRAERARIERSFDELKRQIDVSFVDHDPYKSYDEMRADVLTNKRMLIYKGGSETPLWDQETNWKARAIHDWDHIQHDVDFSIEGEHEAYRKSAQREPGLAPLYLSEIVLQAAAQAFTGSFDEQKLVLPSDAVIKMVNSLRSPEVAQQASMLVWLAAGWLTFMRPAELMTHLRALGLDLEASLIVADAASMLHRRRL